VQGLLEVDVQVVRRAPPARTLFLLLHPVNPCAGRPDFREWLDSPDWVSKDCSPVAKGLCLLVSTWAQAMEGPHHIVLACAWFYQVHKSAYPASYRRTLEAPACVTHMLLCHTLPQDAQGTPLPQPVPAAAKPRPPAGTRTTSAVSAPRR
jgi:hypothetical protein